MRENIQIFTFLRERLTRSYDTALRVNLKKKRFIRRVLQQKKNIKNKMKF